MYTRWVRWSALAGLIGQGVVLLGFVLPYATLVSGVSRWFLSLAPSDVLRAFQHGDLSVLFWALLILLPALLYVLILLGLRSSAPLHHWGWLVAGTAFVSVLTFLTGVLQAIIDLFILFYNAPPMRYRPPVPPISYHVTFWFPLLGAGLSFGASLALLGGLVQARRRRP